MNIPDDIRVDLSGMKAIRKELHRYPEIGLEETRTAEFIAGHLDALGYQVHRGLAKTAVVGTLQNGKSRLHPRAGRLNASHSARSLSHAPATRVEHLSGSNSTRADPGSSNLPRGKSHCGVRDNFMV